jgi:hypothetical protein
MNLGVQMPTGEVKVEEIVKDKDIELYAGQTTISSARAWDYRNVNASVDLGEVDAPVYSADKGRFSAPSGRKARMASIGSTRR